MNDPWQNSGVPLHLALLGLALIVAVRLMHGDPWSPPRDGVLTWLQIAGRWCLGVALVSLFVPVLGGMPLSFPVMLLGLVYAVHVLVASLARRKNQLLRILALATQHGLPLSEAVKALSHEGRGRHHRRLNVLAEQMTAGVPLAQACRDRRTRGLTPRIAPVTVAVGVQTGRLPQALSDLADATDTLGDLRAGAVSGLLYAAGILATGMLIASFFAIKLAPTLLKMLDEFEIGGETLWTHDVLVFMSDSNFQMALSAVAFLAGAGFLVMLLSGLATVFPSLNYFDRRQSSPRAGMMLHLLAKPIEAGLPLLPTVQLLARDFPTLTGRRRLAKAEAAMLAGDEPLAALRQCRLISKRELALFGAAQRVGNLSWAMRQAATWRDRRWIERTGRLAQFLWAFGLVALGAPVALLALATLWPLIYMVERLAAP